LTAKVAEQTVRALDETWTFDPGDVWVNDATINGGLMMLVQLLLQRIKRI
jgi:hypothetical protein